MPVSDYTKYKRLQAKMNTLGTNFMKVAATAERTSEEAMMIRTLKLLIEKVQRGDTEWDNNDSANIL